MGVRDGLGVETWRHDHPHFDRLSPSRAARGAGHDQRAGGSAG